ncbi:hypothetical protein QJS04_geneDACA015219 [Acorus gramineus]|uniref:Uncharacterized protein n=1 Tax=Acorus gramineus TaxID=55184 RepID=A0AAV9BE72_ACOGR|nr:hypothetical protein QJS04_geneDACA015219 [Acorus gramineus]
MHTSITLLSLLEHLKLEKKKERQVAKHSRSSSVVEPLTLRNRGHLSTTRALELATIVARRELLDRIPAKHTPTWHQHRRILLARLV